MSNGSGRTTAVAATAAAAPISLFVIENAAFFPLNGSCPSETRTINYKYTITLPLVISGGLAAGRCANFPLPSSAKTGTMETTSTIVPKRSAYVC
jgi:hypothetical protein